jgi:hypothetical protein
MLMPWHSWSASTRADLQKAIRVSWIALACVGGVLVLSPYLLAQSAIQEWVGICPAKAAGDPCSLCGMTTAFFLIADGRIADASLANEASVPLYAGLAVNALAGVVDAARQWWRRP